MTASEILEKSWKITFKNKALWLFGLVLTGLGGSLGSGLRFGQNFSSQDLKKIEVFTPNYLPDQYGQSWQQAQFVFQKAGNLLQDFFKNIPSAVIFWLAAGITVSVLMAITVSLFLKAWSKTAIIYGVESTGQSKKFTIKQGSDKGIFHAKQMIKLSIFPWLIYLIVIIIFSAASAPIYASAPDFIKVLTTIFLSIAGFFYFALVSLALMFSQNLAERLVVFKNMSWLQAVLTGWQFVKSNIKDVLLLGFVNLILSILFAVGIVMLSVLMFGSGLLTLFLGPIFAGSYFGLAILLLIFGSKLASAIFATFKSATWTILYKEIVLNQKIAQNIPESSPKKIRGRL